MKQRSLYIGIFTKYDIQWGSSRERVGNYLSLLAFRGHRTKILSLIPSQLSAIWAGDRSRSWIYRKFYNLWHSHFQKYIKSFKLILDAKKFDVILIQKVNVPLFLLKWLSFRNKHIIFDFDDLCFYDFRLSLRQKLVQWRRSLQTSKVLSQYCVIIAGNRFLQSRVEPIVGKNRVLHVPTPIDCSLYRPKEYQERKDHRIVLGWMGSGEHHIDHLKLLIRPLQILGEEYPISFHLIGTMGSSRMNSLFKGQSFEFISTKWLSSEELGKRIQNFDIGLMPLQNTLNAQAKCGFKALAYMASGVPVVISPVGVNAEIIQDGQNGFLASSETEWIEKLKRLIKDASLRRQLGQAGLETIYRYYQLDKIATCFVNILEKNSRQAQQPKH